MLDRVLIATQGELNFDCLLEAFEAPVSFFFFKCGNS
jgi:hypothetical protein